MHIRIFSAALVLGLIAAVVAVQPARVPTADAGDLGPGTFVADSFASGRVTIRL